MDTEITQIEWMDKEATTNDNDAIDADMHSRAGDAELILRATQRQSTVMMVVCYRIRYGFACSLSSRLMAALSGAAATAGAADSSTPVGVRVLAVAAVVVCQWLHHVRLWLASASASGA